MRPGGVLYVRGELGEDTLPDALRARGRDVDVAVVYRTRSAAAGPLPADDRPTLVTFASPSAVRHFASGRLQGGEQALAIGATTASAAREAGYEVVTADSPDVCGLAASIQRWVDHQLSASRSAL